MEGGRPGLFCFAMQSPACRAAENSQGRPLRSAGRAAGVLRSHQSHRGLHGCSGVQGGGTLQGAGSWRSPLRTDAVVGTDFRDRPHSGASAWRCFLPGRRISRLLSLWRLKRLDRWTSPTHCPLSPFVSRASACAGFLPAAARRRDKTALTVLPPIRTGGVMSGGPIADLRHGTGHVRPPKLLSAAQADRSGVEQRLSSRPPLAPCSVANFVWQRRSRRMKPTDPLISMIRAPSTLLLCETNRQSTA